MKKSVLYFIGIVALSMLSLQTAMAEEKLGSSCSNPIQITKDFSMTITTPGTYWFTASTYDLPLMLQYIPETFTNERMKAYVDFTCTPGVYEDPNLQELTDAATGWNYSMPLPFDATAVEIEGKYGYEIIVEELYRELMSQFNILYDVRAFVEVYFPQPGLIRMVPDTAFRNCAENSTWINLGDTIALNPSSVNNAYVLPFAYWTKDSVRIQWEGQQPLMVALGATCDFNLDESSEDFLTAFTINASGFVDFSKTDISDMINEFDLGGMYYAKFISSENAQLIVDYKPMSPEMARAKRIYLNQPIEVEVDVNQYYYFDKTWNKYSLDFQTTKQDTIIAYFGTTPTFDLTEALATTVFYPTDNGSSMRLSAKEVAEIAYPCKTDFVFVRFQNAVKNSLNVTVWDAGVCTENSVEFLPQGTLPVPANSPNATYRVDYDKWRKGEVNLTWTGSAVMYAYFADTCSFKLQATGSHILYYKKIAAGESLLLSNDTLKSFANRVDADGYLYFRFNTRQKGDLQAVFTLDSAFIPAEPIVPSSPCVASSIELKSGDQLTLNLDSAFTIYRIEYAAWKDQGMSLSWTGTTDLHTFVAETCTFAVAPYNKYVHVYVPVQGEHTLDANAMADLAEFVDEDGYLYIRFLTEKEGVLTVK